MPWAGGLELMHFGMRDRGGLDRVRQDLPTKYARMRSLTVAIVEKPSAIGYAFGVHVIPNT